MNMCNNQYWSSEDPRVLNEEPLHDPKVGVWCGISVRQIIAPLPSLFGERAYT